MKRPLSALLAGTAALLLLPCAATAADYRPVYHFAPQQNWMNEPNGLIKIGDKWHLFFQHNPFAPVWANLSWGHAISTDLVNWTYLPVALAYEGGIMAFSGTACFDAANTSGLGTPSNPPYLAFYTGYFPDSGIQDQRLAYSLDQGVTWQKYSGNPIISAAQETPHDITDGKETRDPKVFWHAPTSKWVMILTHGGQNKASFWTSPDAKAWTWRKDLRAADIPGLPADIKGWEVPDLFELPIEGEDGKRWVLLITPAEGSPAGGNGVFALLGDFDGVTFTPEPIDPATLWLDHGRDFDGVISWENVPAADGRRIIAGIMNSYGGHPPTDTWKGLLSFPRTLRLARIDGSLRLLQQPVAELDAAGAEVASIADQTLSTGQTRLTNVTGRALDIRIACRPTAGSTLVLAVRRGGSEQTLVSYQQSTGRLSVDRSSSGNTRYADGAGGVHTASFAPGTDGVVRLRVLVDECSIEVFGGEGEAVISNLIFPRESSAGISLRCLGGSVILDSVKVYSVEASSVSPGNQPSPLPGTVHHWRMDSWSGDTLYDTGSIGTHGIVDAARAQGQGISGGTAGDPNPANDPLYIWGDMESLTSGLISSGVPPPTMFAAGHGSIGSLDLHTALAKSGLAFYREERFGNEWKGDSSGSWTLEFFFRSSAGPKGPGSQMLIRREHPTLATADIHLDQQTGNLTLRTNDAGSARTLGLPDNPNFLDQKWHYVAARFDAAAGSVSLVTATENGGIRTASANWRPQMNSGDILIGRSGGEISRFDGRMDEVRLTNGYVADASLLGILNVPPPVDADGDGLPDSVETNTGVWVSPLNTGTDPNRRDTDGDGLDDNVETNTGIFVSSSDTGTNPLVADTDSDGLGDGVEVTSGISPVHNDSAAIAAFQTAPSLIGLYSAAQNAASREAGRQDVISQPASYDLISPSAIAHVRVADFLLTPEADRLTLTFQLEQSHDLQQWTPFGAPIEWTAPMPAEGAQFYRVTLDPDSPTE